MIQAEIVMPQPDLFATRLGLIISEDIVPSLAPELQSMLQQLKIALLRSQGSARAMSVPIAAL